MRAQGVSPRASARLTLYHGQLCRDNEVLCRDNEVLCCNRTSLPRANSYRARGALARASLSRSHPCLECTSWVECAPGLRTVSRHRNSYFDTVSTQALSRLGISYHNPQPKMGSSLPFFFLHSQISSKCINFNTAAFVLIFQEV